MQQNAAVEAFRRKLAVTLAVVFAVCGGNGIGIIAGCLLYRRGSGFGAAFAAGAVITAVGVLAGVLIALLSRRSLKAQNRAEQPH